MTAAADGGHAGRGKRPAGAKRGKSAGKGGGRGGGPKGRGAAGPPGAGIEHLSPDGFARALVRRMEACPDAERLNAQVMQPFIAALEAVCGARGYVLNIYGESANLVFAGNDEAAETIYQLVEAYLDGGADEAG